MSRAREFADLAGSADAGGLTGRNLIINGAMQVAARGTSTSGATGSGYFSTDRWQIANSSLGTWTVSKSTTAPDGFSNSFKMDCTTADASPAAGDFLIFRQHVEAQNLQHLKFGTSSAQSLTLSFWVRSNKTGTYIAELLQPDASNRHINKAYTISSADTWEYKTITFAGDTSGVINNDNGTGFQVNWWLGAGSNFTGGTLQTSWGAVTSANRAVGNVNLADTISNDWYITGVQLEVGDTATPFEHRSFGEELALCQRYYQKMGPFGTSDYPFGISGYVYTATQSALGGTLNIPMRIDSPTVSMPEGNMRIRHSGGTTPGYDISAINSVSGALSGSVRLDVTHTSTTANTVCVMTNVSSSYTLRFDAEL